MQDISIRRLRSGNQQELEELLRLYIAVFGDRTLPTNTDYLAGLLQRDNTFFVAAFLGDELVGGLTAYLLPSIYGNYNELYIYDLAILTQHQRNGIGSKLLSFVKTYAFSVNAMEIFVQADTVDTEARNFYKKNGGVEEDVRHYNFTVD